jgi:CubicO group peptidase (beta-lactamase class C family)
MIDYSGESPGAAVAIIENGTVVKRAYGLADLETRTAVTSSTRFRLASLTKPFIAEAVAVLAARGALAYDETVTALLTHTAGLPDYEDRIPASWTEQLSDQDVVRLLGDAPVQPGPFHYSNSAYVLLGLMIERVSGIPLEDFLRREIFEKHGMEQTTLGPPAGNRAFGYARHDGKWVRHDQSLTSATRGDGGIYSSIDDLAKWSMTLGDPGPTVATGDPEVRYGYGWYVGRGMIWHPGDTAGFRNAIVRWPHRTVIVLTNRDEGDPLALAMGQ